MKVLYVKQVITNSSYLYMNLLSTNMALHLKWTHLLSYKLMMN
jgi:hypothetical protein